MAIFLRILVDDAKMKIQLNEKFQKVLIYLTESNFSIVKWQTSIQKVEISDQFYEFYEILKQNKTFRKN